MGRGDDVEMGLAMAEPTPAVGGPMAPAAAAAALGAATPGPATGDGYSR